jgi:hypothetical protein
MINQLNLEIFYGNLKSFFKLEELISESCGHALLVHVAVFVCPDM